MWWQFEREREYKKVIEVGTGHGLGLKYLKDNLSYEKTYLGIDISEDTITETKERFKEDTKLVFEYKDIYELLNSTDINDTIFVFFGTLEYFTENDILKLFNEIKNKSSNFMIALHEPCNIDLKNIKHSQPRGNIAYSHNYPYLFEKVKIKIDYLDIRSIDNKTPHYNNIQLIAIGGRT